MNHFSIYTTFYRQVYLEYETHSFRRRVYIFLSGGWPGWGGQKTKSLIDSREKAYFFEDAEQGVHEI
jgi:hypothetical protein